MDKLKTGFLVVLVGMVLVGMVANLVSADIAFCKYLYGGTGYACDAYTDCGNGYCINSIACDSWYYNPNIAFCISNEMFYYYGWDC